MTRVESERRENDDGSAILEFVALTLALMIPLAYIMLAVFAVQDAAYGVTEAAREAGRAFVTADSKSAYDRACAAATIALEHKLDKPFDCETQLRVRYTCPDDSPYPCQQALEPGNTIHVEIDAKMSLPLVPTSLVGDTIAISLHASHDEIVDVFRAAR